VRRSGGQARFERCGSSDADLVAGVVEGQADSFDALYERYFDAVFRFVFRRVRDRSEAEDVTQEVFLQVFRGLAGFEGRSSLRTWILGIAFNQACRQFRRRRIQLVDIDPVDADALRGSVDGGQAATAAEGRIDAVRAVEACQRVFGERLSEHQRQVFVMYYGERLPIDAIAARTGRSSAAVKTTLCRSRRKLMCPVRSVVQGSAGGMG
jgi:RNA polymerase sigma-70 factor (ECF subfamily)